MLALASTLEGLALFALLLGGHPASALLVTSGNNSGTGSRIDVDPLERDLREHFHPEHAASNCKAKRKEGDARPVMYVHVHKGAGTMMCEWAHKMGERFVFFNHGCASLRFMDSVPPDYQEVSPHSVRRHLTCERRASTFHGITWNSLEHELCEGDRCFDNFKYFTVLRETISRIQSHVNFDGPTDVQAFMECLERRAPCPEGSSSRWGFHYRRWLYLDNFLVRTFAECDAMNVGPGMVTRRHLEAAVATLRRFDTVVPLQNLSSARGQQEMDRLLGWHVASDAPHTVTDASTYHVSFSPGDVERLKRINHLDIELTDRIFKEWGIAPQSM